MNNETVFRPFYHEDTSADRERIAQQTADFLANGGEVVEVPMGATAHNFSAHKDSKNRHRWNEGKGFQQISISKRNQQIREAQA